MKKFLVAAGIVAFGMVAAQKNSILVGGNIAYNSQKQDVTTSASNEMSTFEFSPTIGYQFTDNLTAGINTTFAKGKEVNQMMLGSSMYNVTNEVTANKFGGFIRYAKPLGGVFAVYGDLGAGYQMVKTSNSSNVPSFVSSPTEANGMYVQFTPALFINFKNSFGLNFNIGGIGYSNLKDKASNLTTSGFDFNFGKSLNIGISKNFGL